MTRPMPVKIRLLRMWRTGSATTSSVLVNEHLLVSGPIGILRHEIEHHDSPDLDHWVQKQNRYTTAEAIMVYTGHALAVKPALFGTPLQRRMWLKSRYHRFPFRHIALFFYHFVCQGAWRAGWVGYAWARLRVDVMRLVEYKRREMELTGRIPIERSYGPGIPDHRVPQYD